MSKVFRRLLNSFDTIFRQETSTALQQNSLKQISRQGLVCLPFAGGKIFFAYGQQLNVFCFRIESAEWAGNFVVCSLEVSLRVISYRQPFRLRVWNFSRPRVNHRCLWQSRPLDSSLVSSNLFRFGT